MVAFLGIASLARADFHDWRINEIFSDASGNVQFIEFSNVLENGEEFLSGHVLKSNGSSFTFRNDLPSDQTLNKFFLVATEEFAKLAGAPTPDYTIPANFLNRSGDTLNYTNVDSVTFPALPTDGKLSLAEAYRSSLNLAHPPLLILFLNVWKKLGTSELALRLPSDAPADLVAMNGNVAGKL